MSSKINWLVNHTTPGSLVLQQWLTENGIQYSLAQRYTKSGWLKKLSSGVYYRPEPSGKVKPGWPEALQALTQQLQLPVHLAGLSSLTHQGLSHYLQLTSEKVWVGVRNKQTLPKWFRGFSGQPWLYSGNHKLSELTEKDFTFMSVNGKRLKASRPELAAYEVVDNIGKTMRFEHAAELFQGLVNLSPRKVQSLLNRSSAVQTNRIFLFLSHYCGHQWAERLDESQIQLGSGKRQVVTNGRYDERYQITIPQSLINPEL
ncbi:hypothetical protein ACH42_11005 [Endozoicomonas sp. (ex Bugula neritina AB1)]|nr:hypothetical protein ACH42_11005 [Endozoicomonas sp. (ex Bugula neritina AB1)]